jgi:ABC-type transporter Mla subunit MlaD
MKTSYEWACEAIEASKDKVSSVTNVINEVREEMRQELEDCLADTADSMKRKEQDVMCIAIMIVREWNKTK